MFQHKFTIYLEESCGFGSELYFSMYFLKKMLCSKRYIGKSVGVFGCNRHEWVNENVFDCPGNTSSNISLKYFSEIMHT